MTAILFLETFISVSTQAAVIVTVTYWLARMFDNDRTSSRLWTLCNLLLVLLVINAALFPHLRLVRPLRPVAHPLVSNIVTAEIQSGIFLFSIWAIGASGSLASLVLSMFRIERFLQGCNDIEPSLISIQRPDQVRMVSASAIAAPFCWQLHQPFIVLPNHLLKSHHDDLKLIVRHEMAHLQTSHALQLLLQRFVEILFWFHPLVWWASSEWSLSREIVCDREAVESRSDVIRYLRALLSIAEQSIEMSHSAMALRFLPKRRDVAERVRHLVRFAESSSDDFRARTGPLRFATGYFTMASIAVIVMLALWLPVNSLASPESYLSPWPTWTADVLNDFGIKARDFEVFDHRYAMHELYGTQNNLTKSSNE